MSLRNSALSGVLALSCSLLYGCGFEPVYASKRTTPNTIHTGGVAIDSIPGLSGQQFRAGLEDHLNPGGAVPANPAYRLNATLSYVTTPIGVARDGTVSRYNIYINSSYVLYRTSDNKRMTSGRLQHVSSYNNVTNAYFSTYISEGDALKRGIAELSELYRQRLAAYFEAGPTASTSPPPERQDAL